MEKDGKSIVTPRLRFPEFRDTEGWEARVLGEEGTFLSSLTGKAAQHFGAGGAKYITYMNVFSNTFTDMTSLGTVHVGEHESQNVVTRGDILFTVSSETPEEAGMSSVVLQDMPDCYLNSFCTIFRFAVERRPDLNFLGHLMRQPLVRKYLSERAQGSTRFNLSKAAFWGIPIWIPSAIEQRKIADCLTRLDEVIVTQGRKVEALRAHKRGLMQQLFPRERETLPRLRFLDFRDAPKWRETKLNELATRGSGHTPSKSKEAYYKGGIKWVSLADTKRLDQGYISETSTEISAAGIANSSAVLHSAGSVILCRDAGIGKIAIIKESMAVSQHFMVWTCNKSLLSNWFLYYRLQQMKPLFERVASGSTIKTIGLPFFSGLSVTVPALAEQQRIAHCLSSLDANIAAECEKLGALKIHKKGLMQQLFPVAVGTEE